MFDEIRNSILNKAIKKYKLDLVVIFGSRAKNQFRENSDYDIAIYSKNKNLKKKFFEIIGEIEGNYFKKVDLVLINDEIDPLLSYNIFKGGVCFFEKEKGLFEIMQVDSIYNYINYSPLYKIEEEFVRNKLNAY